MNKGVLVIGILVLFLGGGVSAYLTDSLSHPPPSNGMYIYSPPGTFWPNTASFLNVGDSYVDPVFGETVTRITDYYPSNFGHVSYSAKLVINADNTRILINQQGVSPDWIDYRIYSPTGVHLRDLASWINGVGIHIENWQWHPTDSDKLLFFDSNDLKEYDYASDSTTTLHNFGDVQNGGTGEFTDQAARYYVGLVNSRTSIELWDRQDDIEYTNNPTGLTSVDYVLMAPDGSGVLAIARPSIWFPLNHGNRTFGNGIYLMDATAHGDIMTDSQGKTWFVFESAGVHPLDPYCQGCDGSTIRKINVNDPSEHPTLVDYGSDWNYVHHLSCNINGQDRDWCLVSAGYAIDDTGDSTPWNNWKEYKDELYMINIVDNSLKRLVHHRSRASNLDYYRSPKGAISVDGSLIAFNSNMGRVSGNYVDAYTVTTGFQSTPPQTCTGQGFICCASGNVCSNPRTGTGCGVGETCCFDQISCGSSPVCGDTNCDPGETCSSCETDCGTCPIVDVCDNLVALYPLDADATDFSGNNNDGTINGATQVSSQSGFGQAYSFDGVDDYLNISDSSSLDFDKSYGTISMWVKPVNSANGNYQLLAIDQDYEIEFNMQGDGDLFYYPWVDDPTWNNYNLVTNPLTSGVWNHVVTTWNYTNKEVKIYVDGSEQTLAVENVPTYWNTLALTGNWHIGGSPVKSQYFNGEIDEVAIWNRALSSQEVLDLYNSGVPITCGSSSSCSPVDSNENSVVEIGELLTYISDWKAGSVSIGDLLTAIGEWKNGC